MNRRFTSIYRIRSESGRASIGPLLVTVFLLVLSLIAAELVLRITRSVQDRQQNDNSSEDLTPVRNNEPALDVVELGTNAQVVDSEMIPLYNCDNPVEYTVDIQRLRRIEHAINVEGQVEGGLNPIIVARIQGHYGMEDGQVEERSYTIHLTAAPDSWVEYTIDWRYIWREGQVIITSPDDTETAYPYRIRAAIEFQISEIESRDCDP